MYDYESLEQHYDIQWNLCIPSPPKMRTTSVIRTVYLVPMMSGMWTFHYIYRLYSYLEGFMLFRSEGKAQGIHESRQIGV